MSIPTVVVPSFVFKKVPDAIEESLYVHEKFPLIIDTSEQASRFLKYQTGTFVIMDDPANFTVHNVKRAYLGALRYGRTFTIKTKSIAELMEWFIANSFSEKFLSREAVYSEDIWHSLLDANENDPPASECSISQDFVFIICCVNDEPIPEIMQNSMWVFKVEDKAEVTSSAPAATDSDDPMSQVAALYRANEVIRNSPQMVEAGFDGDMDVILEWRDKGYSLDSVDGRKHTTLSEAACQGHLEIVEFLIEEGCDPNGVNDVGRSALWRAAFGGHIKVVEYLLNAGADPTLRDKTSHEMAYDVAQVDAVRELLGGWDIRVTQQLMEERRKAMIIKMEANIKTAAEREQYAKVKIRQELIAKTEAGDTEGVKEMLLLLAEEAEKTHTKPRATAEVRNELGQSLLSIATQRDDVEMATMLLTYWKECEKDEYSDFIPSNFDQGKELTTKELTFRTNPNSRDLKGWTCVCVGVFHNAKRVLPLLLDHGGDPNIRSSYHKNAFDIAKDELDAAKNLVKDNSEIRAVLEEWELKNATKKGIFGNPSGIAIDRSGAECGCMGEGGGDVMEQVMESLTAHIDEDKPGGKKSKNPKQKIGKATSGAGVTCNTSTPAAAVKSANNNVSSTKTSAVKKAKGK